MKSIKPKFVMSFAELAQLSDRAVLSIDRDTQELQKFGISLAEQQKIKTIATALKNYPTDEELLGLQSITNRKKETAKEAMLIYIREIMIRVRMVYGLQSPAYHYYGTKNMHNQSDTALIRIANTVYKLAIEDFTTLETKGLTMAELNAFLATIQLFDSLLIAKEQTVRNRNKAKIQRINLANQLYDSINLVFTAGKATFRDDAARYNDYIIYK